jgi:hypothetical protein
MDDAARFRDFYDAFRPGIEEIQPCSVTYEAIFDYSLIKGK